MKGVRRMLGGGDAQDGGSGSGPTPPKVQVGATANPSPTAMGIIKAETRGEAAGRRGVVQSHLPPKWRKFKQNPKWKGEGMASGGGIRPSSNLRPQVSGVNVPPTPPLCYI